MDVHSEKATKAIAPPWRTARALRPRLDTDVSVDVAIIGGGISGLCAAFELLQRGLTVALVEKNIAGTGSTGWCGGILSVSTTLDLEAMETVLGRDNAASIARTVAENITRYSGRFPGCDWQSGASLYFAAKSGHFAAMRHEFSKRRDYGWQTEELSTAESMPDWRDFAHAMRETGEYAVNPGKLVDAIIDAIEQQGGRLYEQTPVISWSAQDGGCEVRTASGVIRSRHLVVATGIAGMEDPQRQKINRLLVPVYGHVLVTQPSEKVAAVAGDRGVIAAWDSLHLYHYVRYMQDGRMLVGGEEGSGSVRPQVVSDTAPAVRRLHRWAQEHHNFQVPSVQTAWRASLIYPIDGLPFLSAANVGGSHVITLVTDGLPFAFTLGVSTAHLIEQGSDAIAGMLSVDRRLSLSSKLHAWMPRHSGLRSFVHQTAFVAARLADSL